MIHKMANWGWFGQNDLIQPRIPKMADDGMYFESHLGC